MKSTPKHLTGVPLWLRIVIPLLLITTWLTAVAIGGPYFSKISEVAESDLSAFLPSSSDAIKVNDEASKFRSTKSVPAIVLFRAQNDQLLRSDQKNAISEVIDKVDSVSGAEKASDTIASDDGKAAFAIVPITSNGETDTTIKQIRQTLAHNNVAGVEHWVTGPAGFLSDLSVAFGGIDGILLVTALGVVFAILLFVYRSPLLPALVLFSALSALTVAVMIVWWLANEGIIKINGQVQGILFILVIGAATDYSLLFVSRLREELFTEKNKGVAIIKAWKAVVEPIIASGATVTAGLLCLIASQLGANKALGPVGAIGVVLAVFSSLTFLPALLYVFGRAAFWPRIPRASAVVARNHAQRLERGVWHRIGLFVSKRPRTIWITLLIVLGAASIGVTQLNTGGVPQDQVVLGYSDSRNGQKVLNAHFSAGSGSPMLVLVPEQFQERVVTALDADSAVDTVNAAATGVAAGVVPLGKTDAAIKQKIRTEVQRQLDEQTLQLTTQANNIALQAGPYGTQARQQFLDAALPNLPNVETLVDNAYPFKAATIKTVDSTILLSVTLKYGPYTKDAETAVKRIRVAMKAIDDDVVIGGTTATNIDINKAAVDDRNVIIPLVLAVITIILMLLLRAIIAPLLLLATTVLSFGAAMGVSALMFNHVWHFPGSDSTALLYGFIFLVALGIDYNIFLMTRVREESKRFGTKAGVIKGLVVTGGVITSAGVVLASTFAALAVIPVLFLVQLAFTVAFGVLLDTVIVRSLVVPALIRDVGSFVWWPSKLWRQK